MKQLRWGILSTAGIARKNWKAILASGNSIVTAVASRDIGRSRQFIADCQQQSLFTTPPTPLGSYEELIASKNVDAIYIPLPTGLRKEWVIRAAQAGKHILCEKPCATNAAELEEMISVCKKNHVQFMDGVMFMHSPRMQRLRETLDDTTSVGSVRRIMTSFSFFMDEKSAATNIRLQGGLEPTGCLGDLGWYCIRFALWAMRWQMPHTVTGRIISQSDVAHGKASAPTEFSGEMIFNGGVSAGFYCSFLTAHQNWAHVSGTKGYLLVPDFVHPFNSHEPSFEVNKIKVKTEARTDEPAPPEGTDLYQQGHFTAQDARMIRNFVNQIATGKLNDDWPMWALKTQQVTDACFAAAK